MKCLWSLTCRKKALTTRYCREHTNRSQFLQTRRRQLRMELGFCINCLDPATEGRRCAKHMKMNAEITAKWKARVKKKRGWKMARVPA